MRKQKDKVGEKGFQSARNLYKKGVRKFGLW